MKIIFKDAYGIRAFGPRSYKTLVWTVMGPSDNHHIIGLKKNENNAHKNKGKTHSGGIGLRMFETGM